MMMRFLISDIKERAMGETNPQMAKMYSCICCLVFCYNICLVESILRMCSWSSENCNDKCY